MNLNLKIEELISKNSSDFEVSTTIKEDIKVYTDSLESLFKNVQGKNFLVKHTKVIDGYIKVIFKYALRKQFGKYQPLINSLPISIIALGSYAREQLCIYSDIDLMIVYDKVDGYNLQPIIETILQIAWDSSLKLGHRVHQLSDLYPASLKDHTIKTALIESRYICGSKYLWTFTENELSNIRKHQQKEFILAKIEEKDKRLKKYNFNMEPDIKSSYGGLRDLNTLFWIANSLFNIKRIKDLVPQILSEEDYSSFMHSIEFLFRIRIALHLSANKKQDRLIFEYVPDVAKKLRLTQRRLLEKTFAAMLNIEITCGYLIEKITFPLLDKTINEIEMKTLNEFLDNFLQKNKNHFFDITYIYRLQKATKSNISKEILKELFYKDKLFDFFMALYKSKQLSKLFEPIKKITHLPQFDGYHKYPVDIHSIRTLQALENIDDVNVKKLFDSFDKQERAFIKIVTLLHDCGKGRKKDHSQLGAVIVKAFIKSLEFDAEFEKFAYLLVKHHTLMSNIASREDIYSEKVIFSFISKLGDIKVLKFLFVLTYADIESVYKGAYSSFNAKTLNELFIISLEAFENRKRISEAQKRIKKEKILIKDFYFKSISRTIQKKILSIESNLLFFKYTPNEIVDIALWVNSLKTPYDYKISYKETLVIELIRRDDLNLGFLLGKLSNFNVSSMDIFKIYNNIKYFRVEFLENITQDETIFIEKIIKNSFDMDKKIELPCVKMSKSEIDIKCSHSKTYARMSLMAKDSPALLANIMSIFDDIGIDIASAKIQTIKNRARNLFLIEKNGKFCNNQEEVMKRLTKKLKTKG